MPISIGRRSGRTKVSWFTGRLGGGRPYIDLAHGQLQGSKREEITGFVPRDVIEGAELVGDGRHSNANNCSVLRSQSSEARAGAADQLRLTRDARNEARHTDRTTGSKTFFDGYCSASLFVVPASGVSDSCFMLDVSRGVCESRWYPGFFERLKWASPIDEKSQDSPYLYQ
jgi:hypothetical protein